MCCCFVVFFKLLFLSHIDRGILFFCLFFLIETANGVAPKVTAVMTELAVRWAKCPAGKRKKYQALAAKAKEQYDKDIQTWKINKKSKQNDFVPAKKTGPASKKTSKISKALLANLNNKKDEPGLRV